jgi:hypothetical protein
MAKMPTTIGRSVPRATRRGASVDFSEGLGSFRRGGQILKAGFDDLAQGLDRAEAVMYEEQLKDEERAVKNLDNEWAKKRREILFGDGTPTNQGFYATAGEDTLNGRKGVEDKLNQARQQLITKAGSNARIRETFDLRSDAALQQELEGIDRYTQDQRKAANTATAQATIDEAIQNASTYYSDQGKWDAAVGVIATEIASIGDNEGWSQEVINNKTQTAISKAAQDRINRALINDAAQGELLYVQSKDMIDGDMRIQIEQDLKAAKKAEEVEARLRQAEARQAKADLDDAAFDEHATAVLTGRADPKAIALDNRLSGRSKFALANALEAQTNVPVSTNPEAFNTAFSQIHSGKITDWHDLVPLVEKKLIDFKDFNTLRGEIEKQDTAEGKTQNTLLTQTLDYAKNTLTTTNPTFGIKDPKGEALLQKATVEIMMAWEAGVKAGKTPYQLSNPDSPDYVGKIVDRLKRPMAEMIKDQINAVDGMEEIFAPDAATPQE